MWCVGIPSGSISEMTAVLRRRFPCYLRFPDPNLADEDGPVVLPENPNHLKFLTFATDIEQPYPGEI